MSAEPTERINPATWLLLAAALAAMLACCWLVDFDRILRRTPDDAYYFFQIAENVARGSGAMFDGIHKTSGFQPLWMLCLVPVMWLCPDSPETAVRVGLSVQAVALSLGGLLVASVLSRIFAPKVVFGVAVCYTFSIFALCVNGMESAVEMLSLAALFAYGFHAGLFRADRVSRGKEFLFGMILGCVMLARLDTLFLGAAVVALRAWPAIAARQERWRNLAGALMIFAGAVLVVSPYLIYNFATFGALSPISGVLKSNFPHPSPADSWETLRACVGLPKLALLFLIAAFALVYVVQYFTKLKSQARDARFYFHTSMAVLACAIILHALHTVLFMKWAIWTWHFFPYFLFAAVGMAGALEKLLSLRIGRRTYWWAMSALLVAGTLGYGLRMTVSGKMPTWQTTTYDAAVWTRRHTDPRAVFALKDTGNFAFFSRRKVINLDGVVNNLEYQAVLKSRKLAMYLRDNGVRYLVMHAGIDEYPRLADGRYNKDFASFRSNLYGGWSDQIALRRQEELYRATYYYPDQGDIVIWNRSRPAGNAPARSPRAERGREVGRLDRMARVAAK